MVGFQQQIKDGLASSNNYLEIDLDKKQIDYRYDFKYNDIDIISDFKKKFGNKKRKLKHRYHLTDEITNELKMFFEKIQDEEHKSENRNTSLNSEPMYYYYLKTNNGIYIIEDENEIKELKEILVKVDEIFKLYV